MFSNCKNSSNLPLQKTDSNHKERIVPEIKNISASVIIHTYIYANIHSYIIHKLIIYIYMWYVCIS